MLFTINAGLSFQSIDFTSTKFDNFSTKIQSKVRTTEAKSETEKATTCDTCISAPNDLLPAKLGEEHRTHSSISNIRLVL